MKQVIEVGERERLVKEAKKKKQDSEIGASLLKVTKRIPHQLVGRIIEIIKI